MKDNLVNLTDLDYYLLLKFSKGEHIDGRNINNLIKRGILERKDNKLSINLLYEIAFNKKFTERNKEKDVKETS